MNELGSYFLVSIVRRPVGRRYRFPLPFVNVACPAAVHGISLIEAHHGGSST